jgi:hypothetical protein
MTDDYKSAGMSLIKKCRVAIRATMLTLQKTPTGRTAYYIKEALADFFLPAFGMFSGL